jgi:hypothetical protein
MKLTIHIKHWQLNQERGYCFTSINDVQAPSKITGLYRTP